MSSVKRAKHAVHDTKYHLVWIPKYRKNIFDRKIKEYIKEVFQEIAEQFEFEIDTMEEKTVAVIRTKNTFPF